MTLQAEATNGAATPPERPPIVPPWSTHLSTEEVLAISAWLIAELQYRNLRLATTVATMMAQQMQPAVKDSILTQLMG